MYIGNPFPYMSPGPIDDGYMPMYSPYPMPMYSPYPDGMPMYMHCDPGYLPVRHYNDQSCGCESPQDSCWGGGCFEDQSCVGASRHPNGQYFTGPTYSPGPMPSPMYNKTTYMDYPMASPGAWEEHSSQSMVEMQMIGMQAAIMQLEQMLEHMFPSDWKQMP